MPCCVCGRADAKSYPRFCRGGCGGSWRAVAGCCASPLECDCVSSGVRHAGPSGRVAGFCEDALWCACVSAGVRDGGPSGRVAGFLRGCAVVLLRSCGVALWWAVVLRGCAAPALMVRCGIAWRAVAVVAARALRCACVSLRAVMRASLSRALSMVPFVADHALLCGAALSMWREAHTTRLSGIAATGRTRANCTPPTRQRRHMASQAASAGRHPRYVARRRALHGKFLGSFCAGVGP